MIHIHVIYVKVAKGNRWFQYNLDIEEWRLRVLQKDRIYTWVDFELSNFALKYSKQMKEEYVGLS